MEDLSFSSLNDLLQRMDLRKAEVDALRPFTPEQEGRIMQKFRLDWNYHSNAIEGNSLTYGETIAFLMEGLTAKGKPFKDHLDIKGHNEGIDYLIYFIQHREQLNQKTICELHKMILVEPYKIMAKTLSGQKVEKWVKIGTYKTEPNHVETPTGEMHYYATPEETPAKMADLVNWLREHQEKNDLHPLVLAATFHYRFVAIHPFDDGNGRMSRLLMNLLFMQYGYPPVVTKQQDRQAYYYALRQADAGELSTFIEYIGENLLHSLDIQLKGARGESLEEPDDLDKEIALLKKGLEKENVIPKSVEVVKQLLEETFLPLLQEIQKQCRKLDELFYSKWDRIQFAKDGENSKKTIATEDWNEIKILLLQDVSIPITLIDYDYQWVEFRKTDEPFNINRALTIHFYKFKYEIEPHVLNQNLKITKNYTQKLTREEFTDLSKIFVKEALAEIKARTGK